MGSILIVPSGCNNEDESPANITVIDIDNNIYHTVIIGSQIWTVENLKTTKYNDGTDIPNITDSVTWGNLASGAYCNYGNKEENAEIYGRLYNWAAVNTGKLAPIGWHVPTDAEWTTLTDYLGGEEIAGGKLKEEGTVHWKEPNLVETKVTGFNALPGGHRYFNGFWSGFGEAALWWSATEYDTYRAWFRSLGNDVTSIRRDPYFKGNGFSVRCVKD